MAGMRYQPQGRVRPSTRLAGRAFGFLPGVSDLDVLGAQAALGIFNNPPRIGGAYGLARRFNGSNTYATSALPDFIDLSAPFTAVVAFVPNSRAISRIVHYAKAGISFQFTVQGYGTLNFMCGNSGGDTARATSNELLVVGQPYVAVAVYDGVGYSLYLNGVLQSGTPQASVDNGYSSVPLNLGRRSNASSYFGGDIALFAHLQGAHDGASLSANPWQLFADPYEDDEFVAAGGGTINSYTLTAASGSFSLAGSAASLRASRVLPVAPGAFGLAGSPAVLSAARRLTAGVGSFSMTGQPARLAVSRRLAVAPGAFALVGAAAVLTASRRLSAAGGAFSLTGAAVLLTYQQAQIPDTPQQYRLSAASGSFGLTGKAVMIRAQRRMPAAAGVFALVGSTAALVYDALPPTSGGPVDVSKIPSERIVVFEGSGSRVVVFEGSGSRVVIFEGSGTRVRIGEMSIKLPTKIGTKWTVDRDPDEISYYGADITQELRDRNTEADPDAVIPVLYGVELLAGPWLEKATIDGDERTLIVVQLGPVDGELPEDWRWVARVPCMNTERFDKTTWFNKVDP